MFEGSIVIFVNEANKNSYMFLNQLNAKVKFLSLLQTENRIQEINAEVILIDSGFNNKSGLSLLKYLKKNHPHIPVIFITDNSSEKLAITAFRMGAREYFKKPVPIPIIANMIRRLANLKSNTKEKREPLMGLHEDSLEFSKDLKDQSIPPFLSALYFYVNERLDKNLSLSELSSRSNLSICHFARTYKKYWGVSPIKHLNSLRIKRSKILLERKHMRISEIAHLVGYNNVNNFIRNFKKFTGQTPLQYRKSL